MTEKISFERVKIPLIRTIYPRPDFFRNVLYSPEEWQNLTVESNKQKEPHNWKKEGF